MSTTRIKESFISSESSSQSPNPTISKTMLELTVPQMEFVKTLGSREAAAYPSEQDDKYQLQQYATFREAAKSGLTLDLLNSTLKNKKLVEKFFEKLFEDEFAKENENVQKLKKTFIHRSNLLTQEKCILTLNSIFDLLNAVSFAIIGFEVKTSNEDTHKIFKKLLNGKFKEITEKVEDNIPADHSDVNKITMHQLINFQNRLEKDLKIMLETFYLAEGTLEDPRLINLPIGTLCKMQNEKYKNEMLKTYYTSSLETKPKEDENLLVFSKFRM